jgi:hypothetical protein
VLPLLPTEAKLSLLAAARQRGELTNTALKLLVDSSMPLLDVHSAHPKVSSSSILSAARVMAPMLKYLDITGCVISPQFLSSLTEVAPLIENFRFGGFASKDPEEMSEAVLRILPKLEQTEAVVESWEEAFAEEVQNGSGGGGGGGNGGGIKIISSGRLMHLRYLTWPEIPHETKGLCQRLAPAVCINPSREDVLDGEYLKRVAGHEKWDVKQGETCMDDEKTLPAVVHIADRFRMAYESQEKRLKKKDERLWRKATREVLSVSGGERAIREWEYGF